MTSISRQRRRANFKAIEMELRYYHQLKQQLAEAREDIIESTARAEVPADTGPGNTVLSKVLQLVSSNTMRETERRLKAIEAAIEHTRRLDDCRLQLIEMKYFDNKLTNEGIMQELGVGSNTFYRWRRDFVKLVAECLGWDV